MYDRFLGDFSWLFNLVSQFLVENCREKVSEKYFFAHFVVFKMFELAFQPRVTLLLVNMHTCVPDIRRYRIRRLAVFKVIILFRIVLR